MKDGMRGFRRVAVLTGAAALACGPFRPPPEVKAITATADTCGRWTATVDAEGHGDTLTLLADGQPVATWTVTGAQTFTAQGAAPGGQDVAFEARIGEDADFVTTAVPPLDVTVSVTPDRSVVAPAAAPTFDLSVVTPCPLQQVRWSARTDAWSSTDQPARTNAITPLVLPPHAGGLHALQVDLYAGGQPIGATKAEFYVGAVDEDLDGDGAIGGLDGPDCNDRDRAVSPDREEAKAPNGIDDNCDGRVDEGTTAYDDDGDGLSEEKGDCDDRDAKRFPNAPELADCRDQDCDADIDEGVQLVASDDLFEANDDRERAFDLQTSSVRSFSQDVTATTRSADDEEWFRFYSQDGDWDSWGIDVEVVGLPTGSTYDVAVYERDGTLRAQQRVSEEHETVYVGGKWLRDDSGDYLLRVKPVKVTRPWCPITVHVWSR